MRTWVVVVLTVVLGCGAGLSLTWWGYGGVEEHFGLKPSSLPSPREDQDQAPKAVVVGGATYDFGTLDHNQSEKHVFVIQNGGKEPLTLEYSSVSCGKCVITEFKEAVLEPGDEMELEVEFSTKKMLPEFRERLELSTNDPTKKVLDLRIEGFVTHAVRPSVDELTVGAISGNEDTTASFRLYGYRSEHLEVVDHEWVRPGTADLFQADIRPLEKGQFDDEAKALVALEVDLTLKKGLPLGPISQTIRFKLKCDSDATIEVPIVGNVISDITIVGGPFNSEHSSVYFGSVDVHEGAKISLHVLVKGPFRDTTQLSVKSVDPPENLQVRVGDVIRVRDGVILMYPLDIEVVKDSPIINRLGTKQGKAGKIVLGATHPTAKEVLIFPRFSLID